MAGNTFKTNTFRKKEDPKKPVAKKGGSRFSFSSLKDKRIALSFGVVLMMVASFLLLAFLGYLFTGQSDQSVVTGNPDNPLRVNAAEARNWLGYTGATVSHYLIFRWFGLAAFLFPPMLFMLGFRLAFKKSLMSLSRYGIFTLFFLFWLGLLMGYAVHIADNYNYLGFLSGGFGYELALLADDFLGWGTFILIFGSLIIFVIFFFNIEHLNWINFSSTQEDAASSDKEMADYPTKQKVSPVVEEDEEDVEVELPIDESLWTIKTDSAKKAPVSTEPTFNIEDSGLFTEEEAPVEKVEERKFSIEKPAEEKTVTEVENLAPYDSTLDLPNYQYPTLDLLNEYDQQRVTVSRQELEENKNKIVETLVNFKIGIQEIKATIGPTVTLYEIIPDPGVKISKIKNLEDDIALSLAALGIRIIAPIPGKGTIGIEVPNKNRELVLARSVLGTEKFMKSDKELPVALGKTISNEVFVMDLAKMPHLLMAGATGQGKSVGLNMILASLVYKKHPSQLKFVLVDPKKVELTLFNKIERHFLAKLPNAEEAIITDTKKVIHTLNSLCIEMDNRYDLLKDAGCRNLKEYNG
ncbi:MAG TPA: DNA translocase FtsK 4TM domain-containing protein, partial [Cyclobacteriaceae bacterium]|nr:DNA translocase FtsK 4TM domain-containing protein [Cyclobacteriaceae bacterium]